MINSSELTLAEILFHEFHECSSLPRKLFENCDNTIYGARNSIEELTKGVNQKNRVIRPLAGLK